MISAYWCPALNNEVIIKSLQVIAKDYGASIDVDSNLPMYKPGKTRVSAEYSGIWITLSGGKHACYNSRSFIEKEWREVLEACGARDIEIVLEEFLS